MTSTTRATTPTSSWPPGSASSPAVVCCEPPLLDPDDPVTSSCTPISATKSTPTAVAPAPIRRWVRAQPEAQRKPGRRGEALPDAEGDQPDDDHDDQDEPEGLGGERGQGALLVGLPAAAQRDLHRDHADEQVHEAVADEADPSEDLDGAVRGLALARRRPCGVGARAGPRTPCAARTGRR